MYLKALEIQGFKSFPDKTVLTFREDITAVVGPNGSGKSNISDAISWVMGEQSVRTLRGSKMEDVIFGGTQMRRSVGFAQVSLILDNSDGLFHGMDGSEIMVTRRYYRSGESEYYINKQAVRLKDVTELFLDTGLGREGYALIGQGKIDEILSVRSTDRRQIFEEAAGISRYRYRRDDAQRKLERTRENLIRVSDKISELELQVLPLREQAEQAKRYLFLRDELRLLEISVWLEQLDEIKTATLKLQVDCSAAKEEKKRADQQIEFLFDENEQCSVQIQSNDIEQEVLGKKEVSLTTCIGELERAIAVKENTVQYHQETIHLLESEISEQDQRSSALREQIDEENRQIDEINLRCNKIQRELETLLEGVRSHAQQHESAAAEVERLRANEMLMLTETADAKSRLSGQTVGAAQIAERLDAIALEIQTVCEQMETAQTEMSRVSAMLEASRAEAHTAENIVQGHRLRLENRNRRQEAYAESVNRLTSEQTRLQERIALLSEMEKEYEGFHHAVRTVMQAAERDALQGIHGPVANLMRAEPSYAAALEAALGGRMQSIIVDCEKDAKRAIQFLKRQDAGRATFLPITAIQGDVLCESGLTSEEGFVEIASNLAVFDKTYQNIFENLLGHTLVAEDMDSAIVIAQKYEQRFRIVTLDGQIIHRGGSMTGGSRSRSAGILSRTSELAQLRQQEQNVDTEVAAAKKELDAVKRECDALRCEMELAQQKCRQAENAVLSCQGAEERAQVVHKNLLDTAEKLHKEQQSLLNLVEDHQKEISRIESEIERKTAQANLLHTQITEKLAGQAELAEVSNKLSGDVSVLREELAKLAAQRETMYRAVSELEQVCRSLEGDKTVRKDRLKEYHAEVSDAKAEITRQREQIQQLHAEKKICEEQICVLRQEKLNLEQKRTVIGQKIKSCNEEVHLAAQSVAHIEHQIATGQWEESQLLEKLWETYELSHSAAQEQRMELESVGKARRRITELRKKIHLLGPVNIGAIEEFQRVNERYTYLIEQRDDVEHAQRELERIIRGLTKEMTAVFLRQFEQIDKAFQKTFVDLFGGGHAALQLEDPQNVLDSGIEIMVQPPGKTLKTITLLSGGEKAFVAIALYFAILKVHPTPFCVMDEIEAALDDANVTRYADYMRSLAGKTQFIVITHRRGTMEAADVLYGVTMQEKGVSKILEINLNNIDQELKLNEMLLKGR